MFLLGPCTLIVLLALLLLALKSLDFVRSARILPSTLAAIPVSELVLVVSLGALPVFGLILAKVMRSPFIDRYFLSALVAVCILTGFAAGVGKPANWIAVTLAGIMICSAGWQFSALLWHRAHGVPENLIEPSSGFSMNSSLNGPMDRYSLLVSEARKGQPIAILWPIDFLYLVTYASNLVPQIYYVQWSDDDSFYRIYERFRKWSPVRYKLATGGEFLRLSPQFMMYGQESSVAQTMAAGTKVEWLKTSNGRFVAEVGGQGVAHAR